ncbi:hypothetical protein K7W42_07570 [Deinococcus sp. HMF7604]|uniref:hypothetical protein n=1 Tax=Deinococcus betulae TaxID=2873312 RepID=UPI001CC95B16|nr:hypothetical protein [Deinococcus betulae]MBZ9750717.1 hypothetical protein [Deinococcus betulae]
MKGESTEQTPAQVGEVLPPEGDARALNAQTHGMTSEQVPPHERAAYLGHVQAVRSSSGARGYLQECLSDRAALALWRLERVARYEAAQVSAQRRKALQDIHTGDEYGPAAQVTRAYDALSRLTHETPAAHRAAPDLAERGAARHDAYALTLDGWGAGGRAEGLDVNTADHLGAALAELLQSSGARAGDMVRAMMGRPPKRGEALSVEGGEWVYEPDEVPGLLQFACERWRDMAPRILGSLAQRERMKAEAIRAAQREALAAAGDALALAEVPPTQVLEKVTRYEAHLERVLYRALHDLEALRREAEGKDSPGPLRGVLDAQGEL